MDAQITVLFFVRRIGPYHHARFQAVKNLKLIVVETRSDSREYEWQFKADGKYITHQFPSSSDREKGIRGNDLRDTILHLFRKYQPKTVVTTGWADPEYHAVVREAIRKKIPRIVISDSRFEDEPRKFYKEYIKKLILKSYSAALVAGTSSTNYLIQLGFKSDMIFKPWDVVDNDYFSNQKPHLVSFQQRDFVCVSRFIEKKNLLRLISAFALYRKAGGKRNLKLLGSGIQETELRKKVSDLMLESTVYFEGFKQYDDIPHYLNRALCLILPSTSDQWGLVVNEAMASGLPVLVSDQCGCTTDLVKEGKNGFIFDPFNEADIAKAMRQLDEVTSEQWEKMSAESKNIIDGWKLNDFSNGIENAVSKAMASKKSSIGFPFLHFLLSR